MMSISELRQDATQVRLSRKRDITGRHKEILTELFYFTKHPDVPPDSEMIFEQATSESNDLNEFLLQNELGSGHVFQESTLPQMQTLAVNATPEVIEVNTTAVKAPAPAPQTPQNVNTTSGVPSQPASTGSGRMITRVSSGAIRHKSVGELLGEKDFTPKSHPSRLIDTFRDPNAIESLASGFQDLSSLPKPSNPLPNRTTRGAIFQDTAAPGPASDKVDLDRLQAAAEIFPLEHVVSKMAHKSVRTTDWTSAIDEKKTIAICARINELKEQGIWSLRQPMKQKAPPRVNSHWDYLLKEMEWMSTDFYEEKKFKMAGAYMLAKAVKRYFESSDRASLLHKWPKRVRVPAKSAEDEVDAEEDVLMVNHRESASPISMDHHADMARDAEKPLVNGEHDDSVPMVIDGGPEFAKPEREMVPEQVTLPTPSPSSSEMDDLPATFYLPPNEIYAQVNDLPKKDGSSFSQLPIYGPPTVTHEPYRNPYDELSIVPISKFCLENYVVEPAEWRPPKNSYRHTTPEPSDGLLEISKEVQVEAVPSFAPAGPDAAHASRRRSLALVIRPPPPPTHWSEQKPPPWTPEEERMLLQAAKDNLYNFELVASTLSFPGTPASDLEKRSAWECFEKFRSIYPDPQNIQLTGPNRNSAMNRLEKGNRLSVSTGNRPKPNTIVRQPRLDVRDHRYLNLFEVMKRSAKNREKAKSQEKPPVKKTKDNLPTKAASNVPTPLDLSRLKAERDRALNQALMAERQAQVSPQSMIYSSQAVRLQLPPNATPEQQEEVRRQWYLQQQAILNAQAGGQALRQGAGMGRGLVIPGGPNGRPMPIRPNTGPNQVPGGAPLRLPNGAIATQEQLQQMLKWQQQQLRMAQARAMQQQAQLNAAQSGGQPAAIPNAVPDYIPFMAQQANGATPQAPSQVGNLVQNNRLMQPPQQNGGVAPGIRQATPQQQLSLPQQPGQGLRATPPRPPNLSPTGTHFVPAATPNINLQTILAIVQQNNPKLSIPEATKIAVDHMTRLQAESMRNAAGANGLMQQHLQQQLAKSSPTQQNQQIRRSPSQNANPPHPQGQQRLS